MSLTASASVRYPEKKREDLGDIFGKVLAGATDWDGLRKSNNKFQIIEDSMETI